MRPHKRETPFGGSLFIGGPVVECRCSGDCVFIAVAPELHCVDADDVDAILLAQNYVKNGIKIAFFLFSTIYTEPINNVEESDQK